MKFDLAYPKEKIEKTEKFLRDVWSGKEKTAFSAYSTYPTYRQLDDFDEIAKIAEVNIMSGADLPGYNIPRFIADFGTVSTAAYWGGRRFRLEVGDAIGIETVFKCSDDLGKIKPSDPRGGDVKRAKELWTKVSKKLDTDRLQCSFIDIQGPLNTAALLWEQEDFMMSMYEEPEIVHEFMEVVTEQIIKMIKAVKEEISLLSGPLWPYIWLPTDIGVEITEDYMPLLSPALYKEFGLPYLERICDEFGGVFIHCCGQYEHQLENLKNSRLNIVGVEFHYPYVKPEELFNALGSSTVYVPMLGIHGRERFREMSDYLEYLKSIRLKETRLWPILDPEEGDFKKSVKVLESMI